MFKKILPFIVALFGFPFISFAKEQPLSKKTNVTETIPESEKELVKELKKNINIRYYEKLDGNTDHRKM